MDRKSMLIIEDEIYIRDSLADFFQDEGYIVEVAERGEDALVILDGMKFDVYIVDIRLSGIDGAKTIHRIKEKHTDAKFFVFTGSLEFEITPDLAELGLTEDHVIYKPVSDLNIIGDKIKEMVS